MKSDKFCKWTYRFGIWLCSSRVTATVNKSGVCKNCLRLLSDSHRRLLIISRDFWRRILWHIVAYCMWNVRHIRLWQLDRYWILSRSVWRKVNDQTSCHCYDLWWNRAPNETSLSYCINAGRFDCGVGTGVNLTGDYVVINVCCDWCNKNQDFFIIDCISSPSNRKQQSIIFKNSP